MQIFLSFKNVSPLPLNQVYATDFKSKRRFKSKSYNEYTRIINSQLSQYTNQLQAFNKYFDEEKHYIVADYIFYKTVLTKSNRINKKSGDTSNLIKPIEDIVFKQLNADDSHIVDIRAAKIHSDNPRIDIRYTIKELKHI